MTALHSIRQGIPLAINAIHKAFGEREVLKDIQLNIPAGQFVAVVGRSGCGKSTLLRLLAGLDVPTQGELQAGNAPLDVTKIGAVGFCFGGTTVLELARAGAPLAGVVSLHGGLGSPLPAKAGGTHPSVLVLNGADDKSVSKDDIASFEQEMNAAKVDWEFTNYSGAVHCFAESDANSPPGCQYNERAAKRAWKALDEFFEERFETTRR